MSFASSPPPPPPSGPPIQPTSRAKTPGTVITGFVLSLLGFFVITAIIGIILGAVGLSAAKRAGKGVGLAWSAIIIGSAWLLILVVVGLAGGGGDNQDAADEGNVVVVEEEAVAEPEPEVEAEATVEEVQTAEAEPEPDPEPEPTVEPAEFEGSGNKILQFDSGPFVATIAHRGTSNFAVWSLDSGLNETDLLVNEIGDYNGRVLGPEDAYGGISIEADGNWVVQVVPVSQAPRASGTVQGTGDDVFFWDGADRTVAALTHDGDSNFAVWLYSANGRDLLVNEIGPFVGEGIVDSGLFQITANGNWSLTPQ
mgnify:FL=1